MYNCQNKRSLNNSTDTLPSKHPKMRLNGNQNQTNTLTLQRDVSFSLVLVNSASCIYYSVYINH